MESIHSLAAHVDQVWKATDYDRHEFPGITQRCLEEHRLHESLDAEAIIQWCLQVPQIPQQIALDNNFGEPPVTLYRNERFLIDAYFWVKPETKIHDHSFSGAFTVLRGNSLHCRYEFDVSENLGDRLLLGDLKLRQAELLSRGVVRRIPSGSEFIHQVWHLTCPSLSLVIRTHRDLDSQYRYMRPHVALNTRAFTHEMRANHTTAKRLAILQYLWRTDHPQMNAQLIELIRSSDLFHACLYLDQYYHSLPEGRQAESVFAAARQKHGSWIELLQQAWENAEGLRLVRWERLQEEGPRLLLAMLFSLNGRSDIDRFVQSLYPGEKTADLIVRWLRQITTQAMIPLKLPEVTLRTLHGLLEKRPFSEVLMDAKRELSPAASPSFEEKLQALYRQLPKNDLLRPLFN